MLWMVIVLLPKGGGDYWGIGLLDPIWKVVEVVMDNRLEVLDYHDCLHGFLAGRGTGTATTEVKLAKKLAYIDQVLLYGVFINLRKAYNAMDRGRCLDILKGVRRGPQDAASDWLLLGPRGTGMSRRRLLWGAVPGSKGCYAGRPVFTADLQHHG